MYREELGSLKFESVEVRTKHRCELSIVNHHNNNKQQPAAAIIIMNHTSWWCMMKKKNEEWWVMTTDDEEWRQYTATRRKKKQEKTRRQKKKTTSLLLFFKVRYDSWFFIIVFRLACRGHSSCAVFILQQEENGRSVRPKNRRKVLVFGLCVAVFFAVVGCGGTWAASWGFLPKCQSMTFLRRKDVIITTMSVLIKSNLLWPTTNKILSTDTN